MDPATGAIVSAGVNVLGGLLSDSGPSFEEQLMGNASYQAMMDINRGKTLRKGADRAGFNPLTYLQAMGGNVTNPTYTPKMSDPALTIASGISDAINGNEQLKIQKAQLELEKERLEQLVKATAMGDDLPGIYGRRNVNNRSANSRSGRGAGVDLPRSGESGPSSQAAPTSALTPPARDAYNLYVDVYDPMTKRWSSIPNPDLMDSGPIESAYAMSQIGAADFIQNGMGVGGPGGIDAAARRSVMDIARDYERPKSKKDRAKEYRDNIPDWMKN